MNLKSKWLTIGAIMITVLTIYWLTKLDPPTPHNHFVRLASAMLQGNLCLSDPPTHLELTGRDGDSVRCVAYPPMPAVVLLPFVILLGVDTSQTLISITFGLVSIVLLYVLFERRYGQRYAALGAITLALGTNFWYLATEGSSWYIAHVLAVFFISAALLLVTIDPRYISWLLAGLCIGAAYWSRLPAILVIPFFLYILVTSSLPVKKLINYVLMFSIGLSVFFVANMAYNYARFQNPFENGYTFIQGVQDEPWFTQGKIHYSYLPRNIEFMITKMPPTWDYFPYIQPSLHGMALWLTSPFLLLLPLALFKNHLSRAALIVGLLMLGPGLMHGTPGFSQFGYRFAMEATPLFILAILETIKDSKKLTYLYIALLILSIAVNFWGVYFIRILGAYGW